MTEMIEVWLKEPEEDPEKKFVPNTLEFMQWYVGGYIETYTAADDLVVVCNEEGRLKGLPENCTIEGVQFVGNIIIAGVEGDEFADSPLAEEELKERYPQMWEV